MATRRQRAATAPPPANTGAAAPARKQTAAAAGRPDARLRRTPGGIGNLVSAPAVDGRKVQPAEEINRRRITRSTRATATAASKNAVAPARPAAPRAPPKPAARKAPRAQQAPTGVGGRAGSGENKKPTKPSDGAGTAVTGARREDAASLKRRLDAAESQVADQREALVMALELIRRQDLLVDSMEKMERIGQEIIRSKGFLVHAMNALVEEVTTKSDRLIALNGQLVNEAFEKATEVLEVKAQKEAELQKVKAQKEAEVQKAMEENVRLNAMVDRKEAQLQAMREQCKFMALNHSN